MAFRDMTLTDAQAAALAGADADVTFQMDEDAFRGFYERTARILWAYLHRLTNDPSQADDLLQESYYRFLRAGATLESESHRRHYLFRIATNLVHDGSRRARTRPALVSHEDAAEEVAAPRLSLDRQIDVSGAMARLKHRERALLWLAYAQGASHKEIAEIVGVKTASVKALLLRARRRMASILERKAERP